MGQASRTRSRATRSPRERDSTRMCRERAWGSRSYATWRFSTAVPSSSRAPASADCGRTSLCPPARRDGVLATVRGGGLTRGYRGYVMVATMAAIAFAGCAEKRWTKPGATVEDFNLDSHACGQEAQRGVYTNTPVDKRVYRTCMRARGYQLVEGGQWIGLRH